MEVRDFCKDDIPVERLVAKIAPTLDSLKATGALGVTLDSLKDLYGFDGDFADHDGVSALVERIKAAYVKGQWKRWEELFSLANVETALKNVELPYFDRYLPGLSSEERKMGAAFVARASAG